MRIVLRRAAERLGGLFGLVPGLFVLGGIAAAEALVAVDRSGQVPDWVIASPYVYSGGGTGARTLLGAVASSTIGVAGTVFSITIAALSLAAGQMGPRLLRNFTQDRGNQVTLGIFLGTFSYALMVLRTVRTQGEGPFVPYVALSVAILLAFLCVATLVFFVGHMAGRINVDTVVDLVHRDVEKAMARLTTVEPPLAPPPDAVWEGARTLRLSRQGYLQDLDADDLADWAAARGVKLRLLARPGDYVFPGAPIALLAGGTPDGIGEAAATLDRTLALGSERVSVQDLEFTVRQLVEVAVRALSSGINDPNTAIGVLDRLGGVLCALAPRHLPSGVVLRDREAVVVVPRIDYDGLTDAMFHMIRQDGAGCVAVVLRLMEVLGAIASCETAPGRLAVLRRHADLVMADGERNVASPADLAELRARHALVVARCEDIRPAV